MVSAGVAIDQHACVAELDRVDTLAILLASCVGPKPHPVHRCRCKRRWWRQRALRLATPLTTEHRFGMPDQGAAAATRDVRAALLDLGRGPRRRHPQRDLPLGLLTPRSDVSGRAGGERSSDGGRGHRREDLLERRGVGRHVDPQPELGQLEADGAPVARRVRWHVDPEAIDRLRVAEGAARREGRHLHHRRSAGAHEQRRRQLGIAGRHQCRESPTSAVDPGARRSVVSRHGERRESAVDGAPTLGDHRLRSQRVGWEIEQCWAEQWWRRWNGPRGRDAGIAGSAGREHTEDARDHEHTTPDRDERSTSSVPCGADGYRSLRAVFGDADIFDDVEVVVHHAPPSSSSGLTRRSRRARLRSCRKLAGCMPSSAAARGPSRPST